MSSDNNQVHVFGTEMGSVPHVPDIIHSAGKKRYIPPVLEPQAHLRDITMGESSFGNDTHGGLVFPANDKDSEKSSKEGSGIFDNDIFGG